MKPICLMAAACATLGLSLHAAPLTESTFTEVLNDVNVIATATRATTPARMDALFKAPDLVRTGAESRAELTAPDETITRVGANTVFSFEPADRSLRLERGSVLFHSPAGRGGGTIKTGGATAAVLGTTIIVAATADGGFKLIVLEGEAVATLPDGRTIELKAGQMVYVLPGGQGFSRVFDINLGRLVDGSFLVTGFGNPLPSLGRIRDAVTRQNEELAKGRAEDTGISADRFASAARIENGLNALDNNTYSTFGYPFSQRNLFDDPSGQGRADLPVLLQLQNELATQYRLPVDRQANPISP